MVKTLPSVKKEDHPVESSSKKEDSMKQEPPVKKEEKPVVKEKEPVQKKDDESPKMEAIEQKVVDDVEKMFIHEISKKVVHNTDKDVKMSSTNATQPAVAEKKVEIVLPKQPDHPSPKPIEKISAPKPAESNETKTKETTEAPEVLKLQQIGKKEMSCSYNIDRIDKGPENWRAVIEQDDGTQFVDMDFDADSGSLFWEGHTKDETQAVLKRYKSIRKWMRPTEILSSRKPSLWGQRGVKPDAAQ